MKKAWWKEAVVYQIYPRSFMDSNGDGIGDLPGIISKLDYLKESHVNYVHLMPLLKTPRGRSDGGYAVADFRQVQPELGTMDDLREVL